MDPPVAAGRWHRFEVEILGSTCHFYLGEQGVPRLTFSLFEKDSGLVGFKPRVAGRAVWIDDVRVTSIDRLRYAGSQVPDVAYQPEALLADWEAAWPFRRPMPELERDQR